MKYYIFHQLNMINPSHSHVRFRALKWGQILTWITFSVLYETAPCQKYAHCIFKHVEKMLLKQAKIPI